MGFVEAIPNQAFGTERITSNQGDLAVISFV